MRRRLLTLSSALLTLALPGFSGCGSSFFQSTNTTAGCSSFFHSSSCDSSGSSGSSATNYVFVVNNGGSTVAGLGISSAGALAALSGSPIAISSSEPTAAAVSRNNSFLYVGNASEIFGYAISSTGALTALNSGAALANANVTDMQVSPDGNWLMVLDGSGAGIDLFQINSTTGALTTSQGVGFTLGTGTVPYHLRVNPAGTVVAATMGLGGQILFSFNTSSGAFTQLSTTPALNTLTADRGLAWDPTGKYIFLTRTGTSQGLIVESVATNGALTPTTASVYGTGNTPTDVALDNTGTYAYVTNQADSTITGYSIGTNEALTAITGSPFTTGVGPTSIGMDSTGKWVLVASEGSSPDLTLYGFDATNAGRLYVVSSSATGTTADFVALSH